MKKCVNNGYCHYRDSDIPTTSRHALDPRNEHNVAGKCQTMFQNVAEALRKAARRPIEELKISAERNEKLRGIVNLGFSRAAEDRS
jgi:hypothetical protein